MGYGYGPGGLACDGGCGRCGRAQGVRKRVCPYKVTHDGYVLAWCPAPALCKDCYKRHGGLRGVHGQACRDGAAQAQREEDAKQAKLAGGDYKVNAAWGHWHDSVPEGKVGVLFEDKDGDQVYRLVEASEYVAPYPWLSEYTVAPQPWPNHA